MPNKDAKKAKIEREILKAARFPLLYGQQGGGLPQNPRSSCITPDDLMKMYEELRENFNWRSSER